MILSEMKQQFTSSLSSMIGALFLKGAINRMKKNLDFNRVGGALLLGLKKVVVKSHGNSKAITVAAAIEHALTVHRNGLVPKVEELLAQVDLDNLIPQEGENA